MEQNKASDARTLGSDSLARCNQTTQFCARNLAPAVFSRGFERTEVARRRRYLPADSAGRRVSDGEASDAVSVLTQSQAGSTEGVSLSLLHGRPWWWARTCACQQTKDHWFLQRSASSSRFLFLLVLGLVLGQDHSGKLGKTSDRVHSAEVYFF
jgi:hypothetical protein